MVGVRVRTKLSTLSADATRQLDVFRHDGNTLRVNRAQIRILEQADQIRLAGLLQCHHGRALEAQIGLEILCDFTHKTLERQLADQQLGGFLVATDLTQSNGAGTIAMGLLHAAGGRRALASGLGGELLSRRLSTGGFTSGLLGTGHTEKKIPFST